jgi:hypothetical protein
LSSSDFGRLFFGGGDYESLTKRQRKCGLGRKGEEATPR